MPSLRTITFIATALYICNSYGFAKPLSSEQILIVYNKADPESVELANTYRTARGIPSNHSLGFDLPLKQDISRQEYEDLIQEPLRAHFDRKGWWTRQRDADGLLVPVENEIRAIVLMRGVPLRITATPSTPPKPGEAPPADLISPRNEACVDSELAVFGIANLPSKGVIKNFFYDSKQMLSQARLPFLVLTSRIDASSLSICKRMIADALETEKHGLWGNAYVDIANKFPDGDQWLTQISALNTKKGLSTLTDRFNETLSRNYPLTDTALYFGWYDWHVNGPFLNPRFQFRPGAVAVHLHSFSGEQLTDPHKNWCSPLLIRGAAATLGNVHEPYLHLTHHLHIFHDRLLKGWTLVEAAWASIPVASWQGLTLGDPLYRPFLHFEGSGIIRQEDKPYRAIRAAHRQWPEANLERRDKLSNAADRLKSGVLAEGLALEAIEQNDLATAEQWLGKAKSFYPNKQEKLRQDMQLIAIQRSKGNLVKAIEMLRAAKKEYGVISEVEALSAWINLLLPPVSPASNQIPPSP